MPIKSRPFKTKVDDVPIEGLIEADDFVFRFYDLISFRVPITNFGEDAFGEFAILQEAKIEDADGFLFTVEPGFDSVLNCEWGYQARLRRNDPSDKKLFQGIFKLRGIDPESVDPIIPPRQSIAVYFNPRGEVDGSSRLEPSESGSPWDVPRKPWVGRL